MWNSFLNIIIAGLDYDYQQQSFEGMAIAIENYASEVVKLRAQCLKCKKLAEYTARYDADDKTRIRVGGANTYFPCCSSCHPYPELTPEIPRKNAV